MVPSADVSGAPLEREDAEALRGIAEGRRSTLRAILAIATFVLALGWTFETRGDVIVALLRHEIDLDGEPLYEPRHAIDRNALYEIDFERFHAHLVPEWLDEQNHADTPAGRRRAEYAYRALLDEIAPDRNLDALWRELHDRIAADPIASAHRIEYLLWAHNAYMDRIGAPYRLEASAFMRGEHGHILARSLPRGRRRAGRARRARSRAASPRSRADGRDLARPHRS